MATISSQPNQQSNIGDTTQLTSVKSSRVKILSEPEWSNETSAKIHAALCQKPSEFDTHMNERMFAHVVGNGFINESGLEGNVFSDSLSYGVDELGRATEVYGLDLPSDEVKEIKAMREELQGATDRMLHFYELSALSPTDQKKKCRKESHAILKQAFSLKPGERMLIPGGWKSSVQGHAMLYELEKTSDGRILFHLFNSGDGLQNHPSKQEDGETKYLCHLTWDLGKSIPPEFKNALNDLVYLRVNGQVKPNKPGVDQLYHHILPSLNKYKNKTSPSSSDPCWMSAQKSGICTWQSILTWQKSHMKPDTYRRLKLCAKVRAFRQFALQHPEKLTTDSKIRSIAAQALFKTTKQLEAAGLDTNLVALENLQPSDKMQAQLRESFKKHQFGVISSNNSANSRVSIRTTYDYLSLRELTIIKFRGKKLSTPRPSWLSFIFDNLRKLMSTLHKQQAQDRKEEKELELKKAEERRANEREHKEALALEAKMFLEGLKDDPKLVNLNLKNTSSSK